jgi:hypothetical protein
MTWATKSTVLHSKLDILEKASFVKINDEWCQVWGYDSFDDTLSAEDASGQSYDLPNALESVDIDDILIAESIKELDKQDTSC